MTPTSKQRLRPFIELTITTIVAFLLLRVAFLIAFHPSASAASSGDAVTGGQVIHSFWLGFRFDARVAILLALPLLVLSLIPGFHWRNSVTQKFWVAVYTVVYTAIVLLFITDFGYYAYLESRVNVTVLQ